MDESQRRRLLVRRGSSDELEELKNGRVGPDVDTERAAVELAHDEVDHGVRWQNATK